MQQIDREFDKKLSIELEKIKYRSMQNSLLFVLIIIIISGVMVICIMQLDSYLDIKNPSRLYETCLRDTSSVNCAKLSSEQCINYHSSTIQSCEKILLAKGKDDE